MLRPENVGGIIAWVRHYNAAGAKTLTAPRRRLRYHRRSMKTLNVIGPGRLGRTLAALWAQAKLYEVRDVLARDVEHARAATAFIGAGRAVARLEDMQAADLWLVATPDDGIARMARAMAAGGRVRSGDIVFHCSGALSAAELGAVAAQGAMTASVHPLKSFADPVTARDTFAGTYCVAEGDPDAVAALCGGFEGIGGRVVGIDAATKPLYHAASALVCNDLAALIEAGLRCYERAGIARETASRMIEPLVRETVVNVFRTGTVAALTGPVARGDAATVARHIASLRAAEPLSARIHTDLSLYALELARAQPGADVAALERLERLLRDAARAR